MSQRMTQFGVNPQLDKNLLSLHADNLSKGAFLTQLNNYALFDFLLHVIKCKKYVTTVINSRAEYGCYQG